MSGQDHLRITGVRPAPSDDPPALERARRRAGSVLWIEQIWPALLPALAILLTLLILSLLTVPQRLPDWLHALLLVATGVWMARLLYRGLHRLATPSGQARDRRIERASGLPHRPLSTLTDRPAGDAVIGEPASLIWQAHLRRTRAGLHELGSGPPRLRLRAHDRRVGWPLLAGLALALALAGRQAPLRIGSGFWPGLDIPLGPRPALEAWITPPDYAGAAPIFLTDPHGTYVAPAGATLTVSVTGLDGRPSISVGAGFRQLSARSWTLERVLSASTGIVVRGAGYRLADWRITVQPASAPLVSWSAPPGPSANEPWHASLPWSVSHRYGVRTLVAELRLARSPSGNAAARVLRVPIPLPGTPTAAKGIALPDLSADPWAGEPVVARLVATDVTGGVGTSDEARFTLPTRLFRNPLARAVLDVRRRVALGQEQPAEAADDLQALGDTPGAFAQDSSLFLNLSADASLLRLPAAPADAPAIARLDEASGRLWELALALEDGLHNDRAGARAALDMRAAQDRLSAQLEHMRQLGDKGQSEPEQAELRARIDALTSAIARRMQALAAQAARDHTTLPAMPDQSMMSGQDLARMMQKMRDAAASGHSDEAMRQLSQMQSMLDHMRAATPQDLESARKQAAARQQAQEQMDAIHDLVQRQSALLDHSQSRQTRADQAAAAQAEGQAEGKAQADGELRGDGEDSGQAGPGDAGGGQPGGAASLDPATRALLRQLGIPTGDGKPGAGGQAGGQADAGASGRAADESAAEQQAHRQADEHAQHVLRRALDELGTEFKALTGKPAEAFGDATRAMDRARDALGAGQDSPAATAQTQALASLQKGAQQMHAAMSGGGGAGGGGMALLPGSGSGSGAGNEPGQDDADSQGQDDGRDPLGRHAGTGHAGMDDGDDVHVPDQVRPAQSRAIEQELRRRDSDRTRPQPELDYLDRLLKAF